MLRIPTIATIMEPVKHDEFTSLIKEIGNLIDARSKTTETFVKAKIQSAEERLRTEILAERAKADHLQLSVKVDSIAKNHERRLEAQKEKTGTPNPFKNRSFITSSIVHDGHFLLSNLIYKTWSLSAS